MALTLASIRAKAQRDAVDAGRKEAIKQESRLQRVALQSFYAHPTAIRTGSDIGDIIVMVNDNMGIKIYTPTFYFGIRDYDNEIATTQIAILEEMTVAYITTFQFLYVKFLQQLLVSAFRGVKGIKVKPNKSTGFFSGIASRIGRTVRRLFSVIKY